MYKCFHRFPSVSILTLSSYWCHNWSITTLHTSEQACFLARLVHEEVMNGEVQRSHGQGAAGWEHWTFPHGQCSLSRSQMSRTQLDRDLAICPAQNACRPGLRPVSCPPAGSLHCCPSPPMSPLPSSCLPRTPWAYLIRNAPLLFNSQLVCCSQVAQTLEGSTVSPRQFLTQPQTEERVHPFRFRTSWRNKAVGKTHALACLEPDVPQV